MNLSLAVLAVVATTPLLRGRLALGDPPDQSARLAAAAIVLALGTVTIAIVPAVTAASDVSAPTARIAAGLVIAVASLPDLWRRPFVGAATTPPWHLGVVPVAVPEVFGPPLAAALSAATIDRGVLPAAVLVAVAVATFVIGDRLPGPRTATPMLRSALGLRAAAAVAVGLALVMNGVYDI